MHFRKAVSVVALAILGAAAYLPAPTQLWGQTPASALPQAPPGRSAGAGRPQRPARSQRNGGYPTYDEAAIERGKTQFVSTCGFCHGANAKGGESGPDLLRSVLVLDDENGDKIGQVVLNGRPDKGMPKFNLSSQQISDIATFLHNGIKAAALRGNYKILNIVVGDPAAGQAYFNGAGQCSTCHSTSKDLKGIGAKYDPVTLQGKFLMPRGRRYGPRAEPAAPGSAVMVNVTLPSGQSYSGKLERIDDFTVALTDSAGQYHSFSRDGDVPKVELHDPLKAHYDMLTKYKDSDIHNLTAYLVTVK
jgi:cytochrome c oxidase cbb3-type subunit 3